MTINEAFLQSTFYYDRYLGDSLSLPYDFEQIKIQNNDTVTRDLINLKLDHLYQNFLYLYKSSKIASNVIPISSTATAGVSSSSTTFAWNRYLSTSQFRPLTAGKLYNVDKTKVLSIQRNKNLNQYSIFTSYGKDLVIFTSPNDQSSISLTISSRETYPSSLINFQDVNSIDFNYNNSMYLLDLSANALYKYDATGFLTDDTVLLNTLQYVDAIGGYGSNSSKTEFNSPRSVVCQGSNVFVLDSGNKCVKKYDEFLNWQETYGLYRDFYSSYPLDMKTDYLSGSFWVLTRDSKLIKYSNEFQDSTTYYLSTFQMAGETFKSLFFSPQNPYLFYIISDKNVYKRYVTIPENNVGKYLFYLFKFNTAENINAFAALSTVEGDKTMVFTTNSATSAGKFNLFFDSINLYDVLADDFFDIYSYDETKISEEEYTQNWVFNKSLSKLVQNHMRFRDAIKGRFQAKRDSLGNLVFANARYLTPAEYQSVAFDSDMSFYIGANEIFQNIIVNRAFKKLYDVQINLMNLLKSELDKAYSSSIIIYLN
jgi:hypothetical protein